MAGFITLRDRELDISRCASVMFCFNEYLVSGPIEDWRFVEMFAGEANVSKSCRIRSLPGVSCDYIFGGKAMDLLTPAGMSPSSSNGGFLLMIMIVCEYGWHAHICH